MQEARFIKAALTKENPKKDNAQWTIIDVLLSGVNVGNDRETEGALYRIMAKNDPGLFYLVNKCQFGDLLTLEEYTVFAGNQPRINYRIASVG